ncbi:MAG: hypothetical protein WBX25_24115 [Rhodomicrobium sp.]
MRKYTLKAESGRTEIKAPDIGKISADFLAFSLKEQLFEHLAAVAALMNEAAGNKLDVNFNISRNEKGQFEPKLTLTRTY